MSEDFEEDVREFSFIFIAVVIVTTLVAFICLPFKNAGVKGFFLGAISVPLLLLALYVECVMYSRAADVWVNECATVVSPGANMRQTPWIANDNILRKARRGQKMCDVKILTVPIAPKNWVIIYLPEGKVYMHTSTLKIDRKNLGKDLGGWRNHIASLWLIGTYILCAIASIQEKMKKQKILMQQTIIMTKRQN